MTEADRIPLPQNAYLDAVCNGLEACQVVIAHDDTGTAGGQLNISVGVYAADNTEWLLAWNQYDGWLFAPTGDPGPDGFRELAAGLTPAPALVCCAVDLLLAGRADELPLVWPEGRPYSLWAGQEEFEAAVADWQAANSTTPNGDPS
jgi:hypothetical protein